MFRNVRKDDTGEPLVLLDKDASRKVRVNFADWLETGETITAATATAESCTATIATSSPNIDLTISNATSDAGGQITITATASNGEVWRSVIKVRRPVRYGETVTRDYL